MNRFKRILPIALILVLAAAAIAYSLSKKAVAPTNPEGQNSQQNGSVAEQPQTNQSVSYQGEEGKTAMAVLKARHQVETKKYSFGEMVTGIDGVTPDSSHFWGFYVNGQLAQVGADAYVTKVADTIEWKLEAIK